MIDSLGGIPYYTATAFETLFFLKNTMEVKKYRKWILIFLWILVPFLLFCLSLYGGYPIERMGNTLFFLGYIVIIVLFGMLVGGFSSTKRENFLNKITVSKKHFLFVLILLWLLFFALGFKMFMHGYDYAPSPASMQQRILKSSTSGFKFGGLLLLTPFLVGYLPTRAIIFARSKKFLVRT